MAKYIEVPVVDGRLAIDYKQVVRAVHVGETALVEVREGFADAGFKVVAEKDFKEALPVESMSFPVVEVTLADIKADLEIIKAKLGVVK